MAVMALEDLASTLPAAAPLIGVDLGTRNIGIAVSDRSRTVATARSVPERRLVVLPFVTDSRDAEVDILADGITEGMPESLAGATLPKVKHDGILLAYAGGGAGLFSALIAGWVNGDKGSRPVARAVRY